VGAAPHILLHPRGAHRVHHGTNGNVHRVPDARCDFCPGKNESCSGFLLDVSTSPAMRGMPRPRIAFVSFSQYSIPIYTLLHQTRNDIIRQSTDETVSIFFFLRELLPATIDTTNIPIFICPPCSAWLVVYYRGIPFHP